MRFCVSCGLLLINQLLFDRSLFSMCALQWSNVVIVLPSESSGGSGNLTERWPVGRVPKAAVVGLKGDWRERRESSSSPDSELGGLVKLKLF